MKTKTDLRNPKIAANAVIKKLVAKNPRRRGTHGYKSFAIIKSGMTYQQFIRRGGRNRDLAWDIAKNRVRLTTAGQTKKSRQSSSKTTRR
jgi:hypothetical protein